MTISPEKLDKAFAIIEACAIAGERCPFTDGPEAHHFLTRPLVEALRRRRRIEIAISGRAFRQVTLLTGPHAGARTMAGPHEIHTIVDVNGSRRIVPKKTAPPIRARIRPSAPRLLTSAEIFK